MSLYYLLASLAAVGLLVGLNFLLMGRARPHVDAAGAFDLLAGEQPGFRARRNVVASNGDAVLAEDEGGAFYLVVAAGDKLVSRKLAPGAVRSVAREAETLTLRLRDVTFSHARFALASERQARDWQDRLSHLMA